MTPEPASLETLKEEHVLSVQDKIKKTIEAARLRRTQTLKTFMMKHNVEQKQEPKRHSLAAKNAMEYSHSSSSMPELTYQSSLQQQQQQQQLVHHHRKTSKKQSYRSFVSHNSGPSRLTRSIMFPFTGVRDYSMYQQDDEFQLRVEGL
jgi:hypothetical protein